MRHAGPQVLAAGARLGRYEIVRLLAIGGMAELYLARVRGAEKFEKLVALKRIRPELANDGEFVRMFFNEARLAARLQHPNIAQVFDVGSVDGCHFFAMELVEGEDLRQIKNAAASAPIVIPIEQVLNIGIQVAAALHYAHERRASDGRLLSIVHRDVSPSNIIVSYDGCVKLVDFGIAKAASDSAATRDGQLRGKFVYMSPEQCAGQVLDRRSDTFSLGLVLYELIAGRRPFDAQNEIAVAHQLMTHDIPPVGQRSNQPVPEELEAVLEKALQRERDLRYATTLEMQRDLEDVLQRQGKFPSAADLGRFVRELCGERQSKFTATKDVSTATFASAMQTAPLESTSAVRKHRRSGAARQRIGGLSVAIGLIGVSVGGWGLMANARRARPTPEMASEGSPSAMANGAMNAEPPTPQLSAPPDPPPPTVETTAASSPIRASVTHSPAAREPSRAPHARARPTSEPSAARTPDLDAPFPGGTWKPKSGDATGQATAGKP